MVQLLEELPPELLAHIAGSLDDAAAAGRWAQACRASRLLLVLRLDQLLEARRSAGQKAMLDKLSRPRRGAAAALSVVNDMGGGHFAINLAASGAQLRPSMGTFTCACAAETVALATWRCGNAFVSMCRCIWLPKRIGLHTAAKSTILMLMLLRGKPMRRVCGVLEVQCECRWPRVELYNLLYKMLL